jgi:hypothetical protein
MIYLYFYENIFQDNFIHMIFTFSTQKLKNYSWFIIPMFDLNFVLNVF